MAFQPVGEQLLAEGHALGLLHLVEAVRLPDRFGRFYDEGRGLAVELVSVRLEPAVFGLHKIEGEGVKRLFGAEPDKAAFPRVDVGLEGLGVTRSDAAVEAVAGDHQVGVVLLGEGLVVGHVGFEHQVHTQCQASVLQDVEQFLAADAAEAVAARTHAAALVEHLDVVPVVEGLTDQRGRFGIGGAQVAQRLVGQHHAPAEGVERPVAFDHRDSQRRVAPLHQQGEIEAGRAAADAQNPLESRV